jgi:hypothetical protein
MQNSIIRLAIIFFGSLLQVSFLPGFISPQNMPYVMVAYAVALTNIREFDKALPWIISSAVMLDLLSYRLPGESVIPLVLISYGVSFISRKIWMANKAWNRAAISFFGAGGSIFCSAYYSGLGMIHEKISFFAWFHYSISNFHHFLIAAFYTIIILLVIYAPLEKLEKYLNFYERKTFIKK